MSKFINTSNKIAIDSLVEGFKKKLDNPYYIFTDKKPTLVTYYNQSITRSTIDEGSQTIYSNVGEESPLRFNKIHDAYLYGIERMVTDINVGDFGTEAAEIEGEAIVLPNTFQPIPGDYFSISYLNKAIIFKVNSVTTDTLENGSNFYKVTYKLEQYKDDLESQVVEEFTMMINNVGTQFNPIIRSNDYKFIEQIDSVLTKMKTYYRDLFFSSKIQTFTYKYDDTYFYDPFLIEFLIRNKILEGGDEYIYVSHQTYIHNTFTLDYDKTFLRFIELQSKDMKLKTAYGIKIDDPNSLLSTRMEDYYKITYTGNTLMRPIPVVNLELIDRITSNLPYDKDDSKSYYNIIIKYFNGVMEFKADIIDEIEKLDYESNIDLFYNIPIIIFIIENYVKKLLSTDNNLN